MKFLLYIRDTFALALLLYSVFVVMAFVEAIR